MIEKPECHELAKYTVSKEIIDAVNNIQWDHGTIMRPQLGAGSRVIYLNCNFFSKGQYDQDLSDDLNRVKEIAEDEVNNIMLNIFPDYVCIKGEISGNKGDAQRKHQDPRVFQRFSRRLHIPVITNTAAKLCIGKNKYHIPLGTIFTFDNITELHWSENFSSDIRWHIIIDIAEKTRLKKVTELITEDEIFTPWKQWLPFQSKEKIEKLGLVEEAKIKLYH
jgi:hypothetical protein